MLFKNKLFMKRYTIEYDSDVDDAYIKLSGAKIVESTNLEENIIADFDKNKHLVGIEILYFSKSTFDIKALITKNMGNLTSVIN